MEIYNFCLGSFSIRGLLKNSNFKIFKFKRRFCMTRWFQIKMLPTTKFHNFLRSTKFILVICSSDIVVVTLFINLIYLSSTFMKLIWDIWERCRFYEQRYCRFVKWRNDQNKLCRSWEVIQLCSWKVFHFNSFRASKIALKKWFAEGKKKCTRQNASLPCAEK